MKYKKVSTLIVHIFLVWVLVSGFILLNKPKTIIINHVEAQIVTKKVQLVPELLKVCTCESSLDGKTPSQYEEDGVTVRYGRVNPNDRGACQINRVIHGDAAKALGYDIETQDGNYAYANYLYSQEGLKPWEWSKSCWGK